MLCYVEMPSYRAQFVESVHQGQMGDQHFKSVKLPLTNNQLWPTTSAMPLAVEVYIFQSSKTFHVLMFQKEKKNVHFKLILKVVP